MHRTSFLSILFLAFGISSTEVEATEVTAAVASNFSVAMKEIIKQFRQETGYKLRVSYGSSGKIYAQIRHGAPFDLFLSADQEKVTALEKTQLTVPGTQFTYAIGKLALWAPKLPAASDLQQFLSNEQYKRIALANPKLAPYGFAATEVLDKLELKQSTRKRWIMGENIAQTYQFISSGNVELGFVSLSQLKVLDKSNTGNYWVIPQHLYTPIKQDMILLKRAQNNEAALALLEFLKSDQAAKIIKSFGYSLQDSVK